MRYEKWGWTVGSPLLISLGVGHIPRMYMVFDSLYMEIHAWSMPWSWLYHYTIKPHVAFRQRSTREGSASGREGTTNMGEQCTHSHICFPMQGNKVMFSSQKFSYSILYSSYRIFKYMHEALNVVEKIINYTVQL